MRPNDLDDDCDGATDDGLVGCCEPGEVQPCGVDVGLCRVGEETCLANRTWGGCDAIGPVPETCNGQDDNCDGQTDERLGTLRCGVGACARDVPVCVAGAPGPCDPRVGATPERCNSQDDDCDGLIDNGIDFAGDERNCGRCGNVRNVGVECQDGHCGARDTVLLSGSPAPMGNSPP